MHVLLLYDIVHDGRRAKVADTCLDYGLDRIQYSAFTGELVQTHWQELMLKIKAILGDTPGRVQLYVIDEQAWRRRIGIEQGMNVVTAQWSQPEAPGEDDIDVPRSADE